VGCGTGGLIRGNIVGSCVLARIWRVTWTLEVRPRYSPISSRITFNALLDTVPTITWTGGTQSRLRLLADTDWSIEPMSSPRHPASEPHRAVPYHPRHRNTTRSSKRASRTTQSTKVLLFIRASLNRGQAGMVGKGLNVWPNMHTSESEGESPAC